MCGTWRMAFEGFVESVLVWRQSSLLLPFYASVFNATSTVMRSIICPQKLPTSSLPCGRIVRYRR